MKNVDGKTLTCGLIGNPVEHTLSPLIHNTLSQNLDVNMVYVPFLVENGKLENAIKGLDALNILGANVTVPYKNDVIPYLKEVDDLAFKMGSVNTLVKVEGGYKGYNTDMSGLIRAMESDGVSVNGEDLIVLGAGGVGRATAYMCALKGANKVYLLNRTLKKAQEVASMINKNLGCEKVEAYSLSDYNKLPDKKYVVIQATKIGLAPKNDECVILDDNFYKKVKVGYDLIYNPWETKFMKLCKDNGAHAFNGLKMLLYQGIDAFELWNRCSISDKEADKIYTLLKEALGL